MPDIGDQIATYRLTGILGGGGMGTVYRAHDERLDRDVALKLLTPQLSEDPSFRARFEREARVAGGLRHPSIVPVFDAGEWQGHLYLSMMLVEGPTLATVIASEAPLALKRVVSIVGQVASALDAAHAQAIVHRDIKPANVLLLEHGGQGGTDHAYLADFGLTRSSTAATQLTTVGTFLGTLNYVAPEQLQGNHVDGRADEYALACTAFEMLTAGPPFSRDSDVAVISAHLYTPPPLLADARPDLPPAVTAVLARAMAKDPNDRFATCGAFAVAMADAAVTDARVPTGGRDAATVLAGTAAAGPRAGVVDTGPPVVDPNAPTVGAATKRAPVETTVLVAPPPSGSDPGIAPATSGLPPKRRNRSMALAMLIVALVVLLGGGAILALNLAGGSATATSTPGSGQSPSGSQLVAAASTLPSASAPIATVPSVLVTQSPGSSVIGPGGTSALFPWAVTVNASSTSVPVGQPVTISAITNADVATSGYAIVITAFGAATPLNTCTSGSACDATDSSSKPRLVTYVATVGPLGSAPLGQAITTVSWYRAPSNPTPSVEPTPTPIDQPTPPPTTPTPTPPPPPAGVQLATGTWDVVHILTGETNGAQDYRPPEIDRTYALTNFSCASNSDCTAKFLTNEGKEVIYHWNGSSFNYGPRSYSEPGSHTCGGVNGAYTVQQVVTVSPVGWDGVSPITHLAGNMSLRGHVTPTGQAIGCSDFELDYSTDIQRP